MQTFLATPNGRMKTARTFNILCKFRYFVSHIFQLARVKSHQPNSALAAFRFEDQCFPIFLTTTHWRTHFYARVTSLQNVINI